MKATVVGGFGLALSFFVERFPAKGETVSGAKLLRTPGGKGSNQAVGVARLGVTTRLVTAIAKDEAGDIGRALWASEKIDHSWVRVLAGETMVGAVVTDATAENRIIIADGVLGALAAGDIEASAAAFDGVQLVLVSTEISTTAAAAALALGHRAKAFTVLNPAPAPDPGLIDWSTVDLLVPNQSEAMQLLGRPPGERTTAFESVASELCQRYGVAVILTLGADGALIVSRDGRVDRVAPYVPPQIVDTTGAGDAFSAGLAAGLAYGLELTAAAQIGAVCGGLAVTRRGVIPALPDRATLIDALVASGKQGIADALRQRPA